MILLEMLPLRCHWNWKYMMKAHRLLFFRFMEFSIVMGAKIPWTK